jgi:hypothetical protein
MVQRKLIDILEKSIIMMSNKNLCLWARGTSGRVSLLAVFNEKG